MKLTTVILTFNEEIHLERAIQSVKPISNRIIIIDSFSSDATTKIARKLGVDILSHAFVNQADQFNWALSKLPDDTEWVLRLDADEIISSQLSVSIKSFLENAASVYDGATFYRRMTFLRKPVNYGGIFPIKILRLFRFGAGKSEARWMDEHILVNGKVAHIDGELIDDNKKSLTWWIEKHNKYASREVVALLAEELGIEVTSVENARLVGGAAVKRNLRTYVYNKMPRGMRALIYFFYRFVIRLGMLDSKEAIFFHVLQGFWYRYLIDAKLHEVISYQKKYGVDCRVAVRDVLSINID